jgi:hypothetical protein
VVFAHQFYRARLRTLVVPRLYKAYFAADVQMAEVVIQDATLVETDDTPVGCVDHSIAQLRMVFADPAVRRCFVVLRRALCPPQAAFQLPAAALKASDMAMQTASWA